MGVDTSDAENSGFPPSPARGEGVHAPWVSPLPNSIVLPSQGGKGCGAVHDGGVPLLCDEI